MEHKADKVSTVEAVGFYLKSLLKERDTLAAQLGCLLFRFYRDFLDFDKVLNDGEESNAAEEEYSHFTPSPFQTNLKENKSKPVPKIRKTNSNQLHDPQRYEGHSLMKRIIEAQKEEEAKKLEAIKRMQAEGEDCIEIGITTISM